MYEEIFALASSITHPSEEEQALLEALCVAAEAELTIWLREGLTPDDCAHVFPLAAALMAAAGMLPIRASDGATQFTAGDVSIRSDSHSVTAALLRKQALLLMAPYCGDDGFAFMGVKG